MDIEKIKSQKTIQELLEFGIINIDKSSGPTSFNISDFVKKKLNLRKTSHFGTLDPKVTGVLPVALNRACKLTGFFLGENKEYIGIMRLHEDVELEKIKKIIKEKFTGKIKQTPPVKSRVKRVEREREIQKFVPQEYWSIHSLFEKGKEFEATLSKKDEKAGAGEEKKKPTRARKDGDGKKEQEEEKFSECNCYFLWQYFAICRCRQHGPEPNGLIKMNLP